MRFKGEVVACGIIFLAARQLRVSLLTVVLIAGTMQHSETCLDTHSLLLQVPLPENPAWWDLFSVAKQDLLEVACEVLSLYHLPKAEYAPISRDAQREQRHLAALKQTAASPISGRPTPARSPGTASAGAAQQLDLTRDAAAAPAGDHGSDEHINSVGHASSALHQVSPLSQTELHLATTFVAMSIMLCVRLLCPHGCLHNTDCGWRLS